MPPIVALVGRPNVGKSSLFNCLIGNRQALVADFAGLTRDRHYGNANLGGRLVTLIDTGGLTEPGEQADADDVTPAMALQVEQALDEADVALFVVDARDGYVAADAEIASALRRRDAKVVLAVNKVDAVPAGSEHEFSAIGFPAFPIVALTGRGCGELCAAVNARLTGIAEPGASSNDEEADSLIRVAVAGRPNVGKSTLINRLVGQNRQVVHDRPGTTRDAVDIRHGRYLLIDTAGVRRKGKTPSARRGPAMVEKFSIVKTLDALSRAHVVIVVTDAREGIVDQDLHMVDYALGAGAGLLVAVNKWDALTDAAERDSARQSVDRRLAFAPWIRVRQISALRGRGVDVLLREVDAIHQAATFDVATAELNRLLAEATRDHPPPTAHSRPIKLRFANKSGAHPPKVIVHGSQAEALPKSYRNYLANRIRAEFNLVGVPVVIETKSTPNPYGDRRNELSRRQRKARDRLIAHRKGR